METIGYFAVAVLRRGGLFPIPFVSFDVLVFWNRTVATFSSRYSMIITATSRKLAYMNVRNYPTTDGPGPPGHVVSNILDAYILRLEPRGWPEGTSTGEDYRGRHSIVH